MPLRFYLTDEDESKISGTLLSQNNIISNSNNNFNINKVDKFIKILSNVFNNKNKNKKIKRQIFNEFKKYNDILIQENYLDDEDNDIEKKKFFRR